MTALALGIVADDLSGAAECAAHALVRVPRSSVSFVTNSAPPRNAPPAAPGTGSYSDTAGQQVVVTVDTDSRRLAAEDAARVVRAAASLVAAAPVVVKKVDSLLRGHVAAEVAVLADELARMPVIAVANPALDRVVREGVLYVGGTPLHDTDLWEVEPGPAPTCVAEALSPLPTVLVPHATVLLGPAAVTDALVAAFRSGLVPVCDAVTETDLDVVHAAATTASAAVGSGTLLVGSGALADAAVRALPDHRAPSRRAAGSGAAYDVGRGAASSLLVVLGTRARGVAAQIAQLAPRAAKILLLQPDALLSDPGSLAEQLAALPTGGTVLVALDPAAPADARRSRALTEGLAAAVAPILDGYDAAFLSGG